MSEQPDHDDLIAEALAVFDDDEQIKILIAIHKFTDTQITEADTFAAAARKFREETEARKNTGDPAHAVWEAWADDLDDIAAMQEMRRGMLE